MRFVEIGVTGGSPRGLLYGVGKFLRTSRYQPEFQPSLWRGTSVPQGSLRGIPSAGRGDGVALCCRRAALRARHTVRAVELFISNYLQTFLHGAPVKRQDVQFDARLLPASYIPNAPGSMIPAHMGTHEVVVEVQRSADPLVARVFAILKDRVERRCSARLVEGSRAPQIVLAIADDLPAEAFRIEKPGSAVRVTGGSPRGLLYGVGKFLRTSRYEPEFQPSSWRGASVPQGSLRGMYFASHFHNWYQTASEEELVRYIEDLALWGINTLMAVYPMMQLTGWDDPESEAGLNQARKLLRAAKSIGLATTTNSGNVLFSSPPPELRAAPVPDPLERHGNLGPTVCPSIPAGRELILKTAAELLERFKDIGIDYVGLGPYDEGGCGCERCHPWGANGFIRMSRDIVDVARAILPNVKIVVSTWTFDTPPQGEWQALADALAWDGTWADYIMADAHEDYPRYPLDVGVPGNLPLINFPEISMWGNFPWGGSGALCLPARLQRLWDQVKHIVRGGFPYSEGIYEDMSKAIVSQFYWDPNVTARDTLREYIAYEFSPTVTQDVLAIIDDLEVTASRTYTKQPVDLDAVRRSSRLAEAVDERLPGWARQGWRWEILRLRAMLDRERFAGDGLASPVAEAAMVRLCEIYHCQIETDDPYHGRVRPPLRHAVSRRGQC